jgi:hypothetical protein
MNRGPTSVDPTAWTESTLQEVSNDKGCKGDRAACRPLVQAPCRAKKGAGSLVRRGQLWFALEAEFERVAADTDRPIRSGDQAQIGKILATVGQISTRS